MAKFYNTQRLHSDIFQPVFIFGGLVMRSATIKRAALCLAAGGVAIGAANAIAAPITISVFEDEFTAVNTSNGLLRNPNGVFSGAFTVNDLNGDNIVDDGEITDFSFTLSGFNTSPPNNALLNFAHTDFSFSIDVGVASTGGPRPLASTGLQWEGVRFSATGADGLIRRVTLTALDLSISILDPNALVFPFIAGDVAYDPLFTAGAGAPPAEVPLPAAAPLMALGLGALGYARRRRRAQ